MGEKPGGASERMRRQIIDTGDDLQAFKKAARQGDKPANEGVYTDVNDRNLQVQSTQQTIISAFVQR